MPPAAAPLPPALPILSPLTHVAPAPSPAPSALEIVSVFPRKGRVGENFDLIIKLNEAIPTPEKGIALDFRDAGIQITDIVIDGKVIQATLTITDKAQIGPGPIFIYMEGKRIAVAGNVFEVLPLDPNPDPLIVPNP